MRAETGSARPPPAAGLGAPALRGDERLLDACFQRAYRISVRHDLHDFADTPDAHESLYYIHVSLRAIHIAHVITMSAFAMPSARFLLRQRGQCRLTFEDAAACCILPALFPDIMIPI